MAKQQLLGRALLALRWLKACPIGGYQVTIIEKAPHVLPPLDEEMASFVQAELVKNKIRLITGQDALIYLSSPANRQGRQAADVIAGLS